MCALMEYPTHIIFIIFWRTTLPINRQKLPFRIGPITSAKCPKETFGRGAATKFHTLTWHTLCSVNDAFRYPVLTCRPSTSSTATSAS